LRLLVNWITNPVQSEAGSVDPASHRVAAAHSLATGWVLACIGPGREIPEQFYRGTGGDSFAPDLDAVDAAFQLRFRNSVAIPGEPRQSLVYRSGMRWRDERTNRGRFLVRSRRVLLFAFVFMLAALPVMAFDD